MLLFECSFFGLMDRLFEESISKGMLLFECSFFGLMDTLFEESISNGIINSQTFMSNS